MQQSFTLLTDDANIKAAGVQIDSTIMLMGPIVKIHWVFFFLVSSPSSLANLARLGRRLNEY
ncbi:hypothetical protein CWE07_11025 [Aliidiomarina maris]|uniref:Uncharacterized protein n=1 Tax=Aliidiomarina maris TaxID=531312 RepID=A0ABY0BQE0_9GAMM|nr:hypothetical protein CWE07_11025 [Aliidiomarina maris]